MTSYLISQNRLSTSEQSRLFVRGIAQPLWGQVSQRLQLKLPDHYPEDPYKLDDVYNAAKFVLHGTVTATPPPAHATASASNSGGTTVKMSRPRPKNVSRTEPSQALHCIFAQCTTPTRTQLATRRAALSWRHVALRRVAFS
ncbi:hypothetical protein NUW54_g12827 [Trametes sanguinea]|uniref:Uncharacterized protein n=1 Tax=Trametes sanguinea TaxID=158606 RepID=A0ACC1MSM2_9APHY|nr:hypothetical protein NUW54_g12827 [Trametes sanguinea]